MSFFNSLHNCRVCANTPFSRIFGFEDDEEQPVQRRGRRGGGGSFTNDSVTDNGGDTRRTEEFEPRTPEEKLLLTRAWENYVHPRAKKMWGQEGLLHTILDNLASGINKSDDPVLGDDTTCVEWHEDFSAQDHLPILTIYQPKPTDSGGTEFEESLSHVNRVLVFLYADDASFGELETRTEPLVMACQNRNCVNLTHISLDD
eukprot:GHVQ01017306.1.p1 GENE.GHVQ01017306.1~~GHVQ01017306.1.p1  ORF type:complete len:202 (+),score=30.54 GHVQ01017306.1:877-1482(+)